MQVGDLVTYYFQISRWHKGQSVHVGLVVETGKYTGNRDIKVMWLGPRGYSIEPQTLTEASQHLCLIDDSLTSS